MLIVYAPRWKHTTAPLDSRGRSGLEEDEELQLGELFKPNSEERSQAEQQQSESPKASIEEAAETPIAEASLGSDVSTRRTTRSRRLPHYLEDCLVE